MWHLRGESPRPHHTTSPTWLFFQRRASGMKSSWRNSLLWRRVTQCGTWSATAPDLKVPDPLSQPLHSVFLMWNLAGLTAKHSLICLIEYLDFHCASPEDVWDQFLSFFEPMHVVDQVSTFWHSSFECMLILKLLWKHKAHESICEGVEKPITKWLFLCFQCEKDIKCAWNFCRQW